jgi:hypothetical protein
MDNDIIYSDEQESRIIRVKDAIPTIEEHIGLHVIEIHPVRRREDVHSAFHAEQFPDQKPTALWWFSVTFDSPEGKRSGMVKVALEEQGLRLVSFDPPELHFFNSALRTRAREEATGLAREYIDQLEDILRRTHDLWKIANEYAKDVSDLRGPLYLFHKEFRKVGYLLSDAKDGGPQGLGFRKLYLPPGMSESPDEYITGDDELL